MTKKPVDRERLKERWLSTQELSGGPYRLGAINRHRQFSLLHAAAKARVMGNIEVAHLALRQSKEARTHQWIDRLSPMMLIERRFPALARDRNSLAGWSRTDGPGLS